MKHIGNITYKKRSNSFSQNQKTMIDKFFIPINNIHSLSNEDVQNLLTKIIDELSLYNHHYHESYFHLTDIMLVLFEASIARCENTNNLKNPEVAFLILEFYKYFTTEQITRMLLLLLKVLVLVAPRYAQYTSKAIDLISINPYKKYFINLLNSESEKYILANNLLMELFKNNMYSGSIVKVEQLLKIYHSHLSYDIILIAYNNVDLQFRKLFIKTLLNQVHISYVFKNAVGINIKFQKYCIGLIHFLVNNDILYIISNVNDLKKLQLEFKAYYYSARLQKLHLIYQTIASLIIPKDSLFRTVCMQYLYNFYTNIIISLFIAYNDSRLYKKLLEHNLQYIPDNILLDKHAWTINEPEQEESANYLNDLIIQLNQSRNNLNALVPIRSYDAIIMSYDNQETRDYLNNTFSTDDLSVYLFECESTKHRLSNILATHELRAYIYYKCFKNFLDDQVSLSESLYQNSLVKYSNNLLNKLSTISNNTKHILEYTKIIYEKQSGISPVNTEKIIIDFSDISDPCSLEEYDFLNTNAEFCLILTNKKDNNYTYKPISLTTINQMLLNGNNKHPFRFINFPLSNLLYEYILGSDLVELLDSINDSI